MSDVLWHTQMSLDGFIAGPDDMRWVFEAQAGPDEAIDAVLRSTGALLVGRRTQDVEDRLQPGFYGGAYRGPFFVLRRDPPAEPPVVKGVTGRFLDVEIEEAVAIAKQMAKGGDVAILGADIARQCLEAGLVDAILVHITPVLLGDGVAQARFGLGIGPRREHLRGGYVVAALDGQAVVHDGAPGHRRGSSPGSAR